MSPTIGRAVAIALASPAYVTGKVNNTAEAFRMALQSLLAGTGVVSGMNVVTVSGKLEVQVEPGELFIPGTYGTEAAARANAGSQHGTYSTMKANFTTQGAYHSWLAAAYKASVASNSSGKERIDLVVAKVEDGEYAGSLNQAVLAIVTGTPEASPKAPTPPESCVVLAQYKVPSGATEITAGNITDERPIIGLPKESVGDAQIVKNRALVETGNAYTALTERSINTPYEPSATRMTFVALFIGEAGLLMELKVGGVELFPLNKQENPYGVTFLCPPAVKWEVTSSSGGVLHSSYLTL